MSRRIQATRLRVVIDSRLVPGTAGGIVQAAIQLTSDLGKLPGDDEEYLLVVPPDTPDWLDPYMGRNQRVVVPPRTLRGRLRQILSRGLAHTAAGPGYALYRLAKQPALRWRATRSGLPASDSFLERLGGNVVHFPYQRFVRTTLPTIFEPWDLQHLHFPQFFDQLTLRARAALYQPACEAADAVVVASHWVKHDLIRQFRLSADKIYCIPRGVPLAAYPAVTDADIQSTRDRFALPTSFAFYPAATWPHKNHLTLLDAVAILRDRHGLHLHLICSGMQTEHYPQVLKHRRLLHLDDQVSFLGFVSPVELRTLYRLARFLILPTLFEGFGLPVLEGFYEGVPVACSTATCLPEVAGDGALLFEPDSAESIADAIRRMSLDGALRDDLIRRGRQQLRRFDGRRCAETYRGLYRHLAGQVLVPAEQARLREAQEPTSTSPLAVD